VVILLSAALIFASREVVRSVPQLQSLGALLGTLISGGVLYLLGALNLIVALEIYSVFRRVVKGEETDVDQVLLRRGLMGRFFREPLQARRKPVLPLSHRFPLRLRFRHRH